MLSKYKENTNRELTTIHFNSIAKAVINSDKYDLDKPFQDIFNRIDNWINEGSGLIIESRDAEYVNISIYSSPLPGSSYTELTNKLKNSMKDLIDIKDNDN